MTRALGVCWYPEHWPEARWAEDARMMAEAGLTWARIGEFAWSRLEPSPGDLRFDWLDRAIAVLADHGLKVVLGTPTATPPRWMLDKRPDMLALDAQGRPRKFGSRRHYCPSHAGYRDECVRIAGLLGARYGRDPRVGAWQIDNEYGCHDTTLSYSDAAARAFREWLAARYGAIGRLNEAWGNVFWSMEYPDFDRIDPPNLTVTEANPAHQLDFRRFSSDAMAAFNRAQVAALRPLTDAPLIHNYMGRTVDFDHFELGADLDAASWDSYPLGFLEDRVDAPDAWKRRFMRQGDPDNQAFHHDLYRAVGRGRWWVMEQQPGPVNWAPRNPAPLAGMVRLWTWEAFLHGAETVCYFRWRQAPFAQERMHAGLLRPDAAPAPGLAEAAAVARDLADLPDGAPTARTALIFDYESAWAWAIQPQGAEFDYFRLAFEVYRGLRRNGLAVDILPPDAASLDGYALALAPGLMRWRPELRAALERFDGVALIGPRAGAGTESFRTPDALPPDMPELGVTVERVESLRPDAPEPLEKGGAFRFWREIVSGEARTLERTLDGRPALTASGRRLYLAGWPDPEAMRRVIATAAAAAGLETVALPDAVRFVDLGGRRWVLNYGAVPADLSAIAGLGADGTLAPADFAAFPLAAPSP